MTGYIANRLLCCCLLIALVLLGWHGVSAQSSMTTPAIPAVIPPPPVYTPPDYHDVLAGKASLRILLVASQAMLAWKGSADVRAINLAAQTVLYTSPKGEQVGVARLTEDHSVALRKNNANFCPVPGPFRLESNAPVQLWTPALHGFADYPSPVIISPLADGGFSVTREMPLEEYLRNVVPAEMPHTFHPQALRAQAVIARTYALSHLGGHTDQGADLCASIADQAYVPDSKRTKATDDAVRDTSGLVLLYAGKLIEAYYHADCGGATEDAGYVWGPSYARPYLIAVADTPDARLPVSQDLKESLARIDRYSGSAPSAHWTKTLTPETLDRFVHRNIGKVTGDPTVKITHVTNLAVESRTPAGRAQNLRVEGDGFSVLVCGDQIRWLFGSGAPGADGLWSTLFDLAVTKDENGQISGCTFTGSGRGHGVGLCQWGANGRAKAGQSFRDIPKTYYPGTQLSDE
jgi:SpoIID/LytB domain protein